jgi:TRAP-type C4-dicarboxylate transport system substrate-binding protein
MDPDHTDFWEYEKLAELVEQKTNGQVQFKRLGGNEVSPKMEQCAAVRRGVADGVFNYALGDDELIPGISMVTLSAAKPDLERESGFIGELEARAENVGLKFLGRTILSEGYFRMSTNRKVQTREDFKGMKIAFMGWQTYQLEALGIIPVEMSSVDYYTGVEQGVVDGFARSPGGTVNYHLYEVTKYVLDPPFDSGEGVAIMNLDSWNKLSKAHQDAIIASQRELEGLSSAYQADIHGKSVQTLLDNGMELIKLSPEDVKWFIDKTQEGGWNYYATVHPDLVEKYGEILKP